MYGCTLYFAILTVMIEGKVFTVLDIFSPNQKKSHLTRIEAVHHLLELFIVSELTLVNL